MRARSDRMSTVVLLADDHDVSRQVLRRRLERRGYRVMEAADGEQALARFAERVPDIVLLDLSMPKKDGKAVFSQMRAQPGGRRVPIVALTAHAQAEVEQSCLAMGFDAFKTKPVEFDELLRTIEGFVGKTPASSVR
jgi:CheY-like chemotaxis protein